MLSKKIFQYFIGLYLLILAGVFFGSSVYYQNLLNADGAVKFSSPDETANYFFAKTYAQNNTLAVFEPYNLGAGRDIIHIRSIKSENGYLKPMSFAGLPWTYGNIAKLLGIDFLPYITPLIGALGLIVFYFLVKELFSRRTALIAVALLAFFPVYDYYVLRSFFHNVPFTVLVITALYLAILSGKNKIKWKQIIFSTVAGLSLGLAIGFRTSELIWLGPLALFLWLSYFRRINIWQILSFLFFTALGFLPVALINLKLYGGVFFSGYSELNTTLSTIASFGGAVSGSFWETIKYFGHKFFYFGFYPRQSLALFYHYVVEMFYYIFWPAILGIIILFSRKFQKKYLIYLLSLILVAGILVLYYGSWKFSDNPDPRRFTIGNSYTRYWLIIYLGLIPLAAYFIDQFFAWVFQKSKLLISISQGAAVLIIIIISLSFTIWGSEEGILFNYQNSQTDHYYLQQIEKLTEPTAVIITRYQDKVFFPERRVIIGLFDDERMNQVYAYLAQDLPIYYFNFKLASKDLEYLNSTRLKSVGLSIKTIKPLSQEFYLYKIERLKD